MANLKSAGVRLAPWLIYAALAGLVLYPLLSPGYILTLDLVFAPHLTLPSTVSNSYLFDAFLHWINLVGVPSDVIEKLVLFAILLFSGFGLYRLLISFKPRPGIIGSTVAGLVYMIDPFTYDRLMAGQYEVLLGYALLPFFTKSLIDFVDAPKLRTVLVLLVWTVAVSIVSIHTIGFMALLSVIVVAVKAWTQGQDRAWVSRLATFGLLGTLGFILASSYWLIPVLLGHSSINSQISSFNPADRVAFATVGGNFLSQLLHVLTLEGFWAENTNLFYLPQDIQPFWPILVVVIWALVLAGASRLWRGRNYFELWVFGTATVVGALLATGLGNGWLAGHVPFFAGYREPQKFAALVALSFAVFIGFGADSIASALNRFNDLVVAAGILCLMMVPLLWTWAMLFGGDHQLASIQYPSGWFHINQRLDADSSSFRVLFLPWHEYMYFQFAGRIIANPAPQFFDKPVIISDNPEFGGIAPPRGTVDSYISHELGYGPTDSNLATHLATVGVKYILLDRDNDYEKYTYIANNPRFKLITTTDSMDLYLNEAYQ